MLKKIMAIIMAVLGLVVIVIGVSVLTTPVDSGKNISGGYYDIESASFGGDFYTYTYKGLDTIVDALDGLNDRVASVGNAVNAGAEATQNAVYQAGGMLIIAIGIGVLAMGLKAIGGAFQAANQPAVTKAMIPNQPVAPVQQNAQFGAMDQMPGFNAMENDFTNSDQPGDNM